MRKKRNFIWRAAALLMALSIATSSLALARAKYISTYDLNGQFSMWTFIVIVHDSGTANNRETTYKDMPAGYWAFYAKGGHGSNPNNDKALPGILCGIYNKAERGDMCIGNCNYGSATGGANPGDNGKYIVDADTRPKTAPANTVTPPNGAYEKIIVVAGGGGGGFNDGTNCDPGSAGASGSSALNGSTTPKVIAGGRGDYSGAAPGDGYGGGTTAGGSNNGAWFTGGAGSDPTVGFKGGGGGGGIWGGGGGNSSIAGRRTGGGGASYICKSDAVPRTTNPSGTVYGYNTFTFNPYPNPTKYCEYALNYFFSAVSGTCSNSNATWGEVAAVLVYLGTELPT